MFSTAIKQQSAPKIVKTKLATHEMAKKLAIFLDSFKYLYPRIWLQNSIVTVNIKKTYTGFNLEVMLNPVTSQELRPGTFQITTNVQIRSKECKIQITNYEDYKISNLMMCLSYLSPEGIDKFYVRWADVLGLEQYGFDQYFDFLKEYGKNNGYWAEYGNGSHGMSSIYDKSYNPGMAALVANLGITENEVKDSQLQFLDSLKVIDGKPLIISTDEKKNQLIRTSQLSGITCYLFDSEFSYLL